MKRHFEIMRIMRTKVLDPRELWYSVESIVFVQDAIRYRVDDLASMFAALSSAMWHVDMHVDIFSQSKLDPQKQFQNFVYGIVNYLFFFWTVLLSDIFVSQFKYFHDRKALWSVDYVQNLSPAVIPYDDASEDQNVKPEDILKYEYTDELALDDWVYDGHSTEDIPSYHDVKPPLKDMCALCFIFMPPPFSSSNHAVQFRSLARLFLRRRRHPRDQRN
jgi:hypothetical protein